MAASPSREGAAFLTPRGRERDVWAAVATRSGAFVGWFSLRRLREGESSATGCVATPGVAAWPPRVQRRWSPKNLLTWTLTASSRQRWWSTLPRVAWWRRRAWLALPFGAGAILFQAAPTAV